MSTLVIPDIHGKSDLLLSMLKNADKYDRIIQIGDLCNCVLQDRDGDIECCNIALNYNIEVLVGNHEHPYFGGGAFGGFYFIPEVKDAIKSLNMQAATKVGDIVITHAGIHPAYQDTSIDSINFMWATYPTADIFEDCSYIRGGGQSQGGILWRDFSEPSFNGFKQVFGHTKDTTVRLDESENVCIDCEMAFVI